MSIAVLPRRRPAYPRFAPRMAYWNGAVWAVGNGLASGPLVAYLAMELKTPRLGLSIGVLLAAQHLIGGLRLVVPPMIGRLAERKRFCVASYVLSGMALAALPLTVAFGRLPSDNRLAAAIAGLWCAYHLLEYFATVALWSWLADLVPQPIRGRFLGRRERWMTLGQAAGMLSSGLFVWGWHETAPDGPRWLPYTISAALGAAMLTAAVVPLALMPATADRRSRPPRVDLRAMLAPFADVRFLRLLAFGCWMSAFNGLTQAPQNIFPNRVLGLPLLAMLGLKVGLRAGQSAVCPALGRAADRWGNRRLMALGLLVVAQGPLFYCLATPERPWWIVGAWVCWIAWAAINIAQPNLMLKLSPQSCNTPYIATWFAVTGVCHGVSTVLGGMLFDAYGQRVFEAGALRMDYYQLAFLFAWVTTSLGVVVLLASGTRARGARRVGAERGRPMTGFPSISYAAGPAPGHSVRGFRGSTIHTRSGRDRRSKRPRSRLDPPERRGRKLHRRADETADGLTMAGSRKSCRRRSRTERAVQFARAVRHR